VVGCSDDAASDDATAGTGGSSASAAGGNGGSSASSSGGSGAGDGGGSAADGSAASPSSGGVGGGVGGTGGGVGGGGTTGTGGSGTGGSGGTPPGGCRPLDVACGDPGVTCCAGTECVQATPDPLCLVPCEVDTDCTTGCCMQYGNVRRKVCGTATECATCVGPGQTCGTQSPCCGSSICATIENVAECREECTVASDCSTNCCLPLANVSKLVCLDPKYCPDGGP
jgi:hypothetical protein